MKRIIGLLLLLAIFGMLLAACGGGGSKCINCTTSTPQPSVAEQYEEMEFEATREAAIQEAEDDFSAEEADKDRALFEALEEVIEETSQFQIADPCGLSTQDCPPN